MTRVDQIISHARAVARKHGSDDDANTMLVLAMMLDGAMRSMSPGFARLAPVKQTRPPKPAPKELN